jgi:hypothetical protein
MSAKARHTLEAVFIGLGAEVSEGSGSRVRISLSGVRYVYHRPHPEGRPARAQWRQYGST